MQDDITKKLFRARNAVRIARKKKKKNHLPFASQHAAFLAPLQVMLSAGLGRFMCVAGCGHAFFEVGHGGCAYGVGRWG